MKLTVTLCLLLVVYSASAQKYYKEPKQFPLVKDYKQFLEEYHENKRKDPRYQNAQFVEERQADFLRMKNEVDVHHASYLLGLSTYDRKLQRWSDLSKKEKKRTLCGARLPKRTRAPTNAAYLRMLKTMPKVENGTQVNHCQFPNPIQDQLACGCCWAFSCAQVLEHQLMVKKNRRVHLSVQQLVDCDTTNDACDGGWPTNGFRHVQIFGVSDASEYSYQEHRQDYCKRAFYRRLLPQHFIEQQMEVELKGDEESMKKIILRVGAVVIGMHADEAFLTITKGLYQNENCPKNDPNHAMVVCGFGSDANGEYWLVRNSWGSGWGEYGYVKMKMGNTCGVANVVMWPIILDERSLNPFNYEYEAPLSEKSDDSEHLKL